MYNGTQSEVGAIGVSCSQEFERLLNSYGVRDRFVDQNWGDSKEENKNQENIFNPEDNNIEAQNQMQNYESNTTEQIINNPNSFEQETQCLKMCVYHFPQWKP